MVWKCPGADVISTVGSCIVKKEVKTAYIQLHTAIFLFGFTAILGKLISLQETMLVWHRLWITCVSLIFLPGVYRAFVAIPNREKLRFAGIGIVTSLHWLAFYGAIKYSNVSIALSCLATTSLFTSFIEPWLFKKRINWMEVVLGLIVVIGIVIITRATLGYATGIAMGLLAALLASLFSTLNKKYMGNTHPVAITFTELGTGFIFVSLLLPLYYHYFPQAVFVPEPMDWIYLLVLSLVCTSWGYVLGLQALRHLSAFTANLSVNLEPVYGIVMAAIIFGEHKELTTEFYLGTLLVLLSVCIHPLIRSGIFSGKRAAVPSGE